MTRLLPLLLAALLLAGCTFNVKESNIVFGGSVLVPDIAQMREANPGYRVEERRIRTGDGEELFSLRFIREDAVATVLYFGGNGYTIARQGGRTSGAYRDLPVNLVLVDHRGYGGSTGSASLPALMSDAVEVHDAVRADPTLGGLPLVVHGHSLGSFMAGAVADRRTLDGLVLESTVTTAEAWTAHLRSQQPWWIRAVVWRVRPGETLRGLGNAGPVSRLDEPVLFVVGEDDDVTPPKFSRELHEAVPVPPDRRQLLVASGRGHADATDTPEFRTAVAVLLERSTAANEVAEEAASPVAVAELDEFALRLARAGTFSGVVLVAKDGQVLLERAYGKRDARGEDENTIDTRFNLASAGKMFTAVAILQQVAAGRITLDTSVGEVLKDYPNEDFATQVTIRQLLTHTAGAGDIDLFGV